VTRPCDAFALEEEFRAEGNARRAAEIASTPGHPSTGSLPLYQESARAAFEAAAANTTQPNLG
jgi:hypothetical protein